MPDQGIHRRAVAIDRGMAVGLTTLRRATATNLTMGIRMTIVDQPALVVQPALAGNNWAASRFQAA